MTYPFFCGEAIVSDSTYRRRFLVLDLEATCWEDKVKQRKESEIIQIGAAMAVPRENRVEPIISVIVKPQHSEVSDFCTELTGITQSDVNNGVPLKEAFFQCQKAWGPTVKNWGSWGFYDKNMIDRECFRKSLPNPFGLIDHHVNISALFSLLTGKKSRYGVSKALRSLGMEFEGNPHDALADAVNTARIFVGLSALVQEGLRPKSKNKR